MIGILSPFVILLSVLFIFVLIQNRRNRMRHKKEIFSKEMHLRKLIHSHNKDELEIEPTNVELYEILGEGAFGIVRKGFLKTTNKAIAVKMLKGIENRIDSIHKNYQSIDSLLRKMIFFHFKTIF